MKKIEDLLPNFSNNADLRYIYRWLNDNNLTERLYQDFNISKVNRRTIEDVVKLWDNHKSLHCFGAQYPTEYKWLHKRRLINDFCNRVGYVRQKRKTRTYEDCISEWKLFNCKTINEFTKSNPDGINIIMWLRRNNSMDKFYNEINYKIK